MTKRPFALLLAASILVPAASGAQTSDPMASSSSVLAAQSSVAVFYSSYSVQPIWFRGGVANPAIADLVRILRRAPFDGFAAGPQLAAQVEAAAARIGAGASAADLKTAERTLSTAWVAYAQWMKRKTPGMIYAYPVLAPQGGRTDQILLSAAQAASLQAHLNSVANINPIYVQLRETAWAEAQAKGNMTPDPRLIANVDRARSLPSGGRFILVDAGSQMLYMYENGQPVDSMKVVVGDKEKLGLPTPMIASVIHYMTFNPYWNVPHHLVRKMVANPDFKKDPAKYLKSKKYEVMSDWTEQATAISPDGIDWKAVGSGEKQIRVRQLPGPLNSMGKMKFPFPSGQDIYLHDTPTREYFAKANRALSNGCVRLEAAPRLARWLLGRDPVAPSSEPEIRTQLPQGVPVYLTYLTAKPTATGIAYLEDIYGWDVPGAQVAAITPAANLSPQ
ncbi:MAG: L,D-transpeptidase family protein [Sphingomicrobium sp.]